MAAVTICNDFKAQEEEICHYFHLFPFYLPLMGLDAMTLVFLMFSFKPAFSLSSFTLIKRLFSPPHFLPLEWCHPDICGCWYPIVHGVSKVRHNWATEHAHMHTISLPCFAFSLRKYTRCSGPCFPLLSSVFWLKLLFPHVALHGMGFLANEIHSSFSDAETCLLSLRYFHKLKWSLQQRCNKDIYSTVMPFISFLWGSALFM